MTASTGSARVSVSSPLAQTLLFESIAYRSALSTLEETRLALRSDDADIELAQLSQQLLVVGFDAPGKEADKRYISGYVVDCHAGRDTEGHDGRLSSYATTLRPWLWFLTLQSDFRIYQDQTTRQIVEAVFSKYTQAKFDFKLMGSYPNLACCTQLFETDFDFVARLLAHEGIYWYFEHRRDGHTLVLVDSSSAHSPAAGYASVSYFEDGATRQSIAEHVSRCQFRRSVRPTTATLHSYDFENPAASLHGQTGAASASAAPYEIFDYHGQNVVTLTSNAANTTRLQNLSRVRLEELQSDSEVLTGEGNVVGLELGRCFELANHRRSPSGTQYLLTQVAVDSRIRVGESAIEGDEGDDFVCHFSAINKTRQFRPARRPKPIAKGPVSAVVVGPAGEEIFTDKYGRVKLQFHFDRYGENDATSSCWVRVNQTSAGANFGAVQIPRIGQEVIVAFLDGDPDQPLVIGAVYNAQRMPPWTLPANATQSGFLSRSSKNGSFEKANALRFDDKAGAEQLLIHAEMAFDLEVEKNETHWVGGDRSVKLDGDEKVTIAKSRTETITKDLTTTISGKRSTTISDDDLLTIAKRLVVKADQSISLTSGSASITLNADGSIAISGASISIRSSGATTVQAGSSIGLKAASSASLEAGASVAISGGSSVAIKGARVSNN